MNDEDITKLAAKLTQSLATKDDISELKNDITKLAAQADFLRLEEKVDEILKHVEGLGDTDDDHEIRLKRIENIPTIAQQLKQ